MWDPFVWLVAGTHLVYSAKGIVQIDFHERSGIYFQLSFITIAQRTFQHFKRCGNKCEQALKRSKHISAQELLSSI
jgi:hypothetical protein